MFDVTVVFQVLCVIFFSSFFLWTFLKDNMNFNVAFFGYAAMLALMLHFKIVKCVCLVIAVVFRL